MLCGIFRKGTFLSVVIVGLLSGQACYSQQSFDDLIQDTDRYEQPEYQPVFVDDAELPPLPFFKSLIPEPSTLACLGLGLCILVRRRIRGG